MPNIALGILTRGRSADAIACVSSALATSHATVYVVVDDDRDALDKIATYFEGNPRVRFGFLPIRHYYVRGMNALYGWMRDDGADYFVVSNDDVRFVANQWDVRAVAGLQEAFTDGLGILELAGPELCAHYISRVAFIETCLGGRIADPAYTFYCSDTELRERCRALGRYAWWHGAPLLEHAVKQDALRSECSYWLSFDRAEYARRWQPGWRKEVWQA